MPAEYSNSSVSLNARILFFMLPLLFIIANGVMLLNNGLFFDDTTHYMASEEAFDLIRNHARTGWFFYAPLMEVIYSSEVGIFLGRLLSFLSYLGASFFLYFTLRRTGWLREISIIFIVGIFALMPLNTSTISLVVTYYSLSYLWFYIACWLLVHYIENHRIWLRVVCLLLFAVSFLLESLLVFYALPLLYLIYKSWPAKTGVKELIKLVVNHLDFILIPIAFWLARSAYFRPVGMFGGYNEVKLSTLVSLPVNMLDAFYFALWEPVKNSMETALDNPLRVLIIGAIAWLFVFRYEIPPVSKKDWKGLAFGVAAAAFGIAPYLLTGKHVFTGFGTRHLAIMALGCSFIVYFGLRRLAVVGEVSDRLFKVILCLLLAMFSYASLEYNLDFLKRAYTRQALISVMANDPIIKANKTFVLVDEGYYYRTQPYRPRDFLGMMRLAYGDGARFGFFVDGKMDMAELRILLDGYIEKRTANAKNSETADIYKEIYGGSRWIYKVGDPIVEITLRPGPNYPNQRDALKLTWQRFFNPEAFDRELKNVVSLSTRVIAGPLLQK